MIGNTLLQEVERQEAELEPLHSSDGQGPLLQRDYVLRVDGSRLTTAGVVELIRRDFGSFAPQDLAAFQRIGTDDRPLQVGDVLSVDIIGTGRAHVNIIHSGEQSITMRTQQGHPEAGRITFGAHRDQEGRLLLHIRSRARSGGFFTFLGYTFGGGKKIQAEVWKCFLERLAEACGGRPAGPVEVTEQEVSERLSDTAELDLPTFLS